MALVNVTSVNILNNPCAFTEPLQFEIQYECMADLQEDLEWKVTYVGSAESQEYDQVLDSVLVGPIVAGQYRFVLQTDAPDASKMRSDDIIGITIILIDCLYKDKEFLRVGYYVNNDYGEPEMRESPPDVLQVERLVRSLLEDKPRVTRFPIEWDELPHSVPTIGDENVPPAENFATEAMEEDYSFQKPINMSDPFSQHGHPAQDIDIQQNQGFGGFGSGFSGQASLVDAGTVMEE